MYFALLVTQLPHVNDALGHYPDTLARRVEPHRAGQAIARCVAALSALFKRVG